MRFEAALPLGDNAVEDVCQASKCYPLAAECTRIVTTSWDDGDPLDLRVGGLLADRKLPGTFYIPVNGHHNVKRMDRGQIELLDSWGFEIGAHGVSHLNLAECGPEQLVLEVESCKKYLEDDLGKRVPVFAYPGGRHSETVILALKQAGYAGARTTAMLARGLVFDPFKMPTSVHVFPHTRADYLKNLARASDLGRAWEYMTRLRLADNWADLAKALFDAVMREGGIWHLYGHSWEIASLGLWESLEKVLDYVSGRQGVMYLSNGGILDFLPGHLVEGSRSSRQPAI